MHHNQIGDEGATAFADMLRVNSSLLLIDVRSNKIRGLGMCVLAGSLWMYEWNVSMCVLAGSLWMYEWNVSMCVLAGSLAQTIKATIN
jgi:hypothetical protein